MVGGRRGRRFSVWLAVIGFAMSVGSLAWALMHVRHGAPATDAVALLGFPVGVAGLAVAVAGLRAANTALALSAVSAAAARSDAATAADQLRRIEQEQWLQLVGGEIEHINLRYTLRVTSGAATVPAGEGQLFDDGTTTVPDIAAFYRGTLPARLVVTGSPGGGKTVLAIELLVALINGRADSAPVPVRLPLAQWDLNADPGLEDFITSHLADVLDWQRDRARQLVEHNLVLPILDGLDEMDATVARDGRPALDSHGYPVPDPRAPRARAVLDLLNSYQDANHHGRRGAMVLTCRGAHYDALPEQDRLRTAARIQIAHVAPDEAAAYLERHSGGSPRWRPVVQHLRAEPQGTLARTLSTPWRLALAATGYRRDGDPAELLTLATAVELNEHLLARYIPAATRTTPNPRLYQPADVHRWLHHLAQALTVTTPAGSAPTGGSTSGTDVVLHHIWPVGGRTRIRLVDAALTAAAVFVLWLPLLAINWDPVSGLPVVAVLALALSVRSATARVKAPHPLRWRGMPPLTGLRPTAALVIHGFRSGYNDVRDRSLRVIKRTAEGAALAYAVVAVLAYGFQVIDFPAWVPATYRPDFLGELEAGHLVPRLIETVMFGLAFGGIVGLLLISLPVYSVAVFSGLISAATAGLTDGSAQPATPRSVIRDDLAANGAIALTAGAAAALVTCIGHDAEAAAGFGWLVFVVSLLGAARNAGRRYVAFVVCSALNRQLPVRLGTFLDWADAAGLLRHAGPAFQFRHRELQRWLAAHPEPPPAHLLRRTTGTAT